jgi:hypothetical protein
MFSGIPLPNMNDISIPAKLAQLNELQKQHLENQYYPQNAMAKNASQLAYANLMGPQFLAKLIGNPAILSNTPDEQKNSLLKRLYAAGGQGASNPFSQNDDQSGSLSRFLTNKLKGLFGSSEEKKAPQNPFSTAGLSSNDQNAIAGMKPGDSYVVQGNSSNPMAASSQDPLNTIPVASNKPTFAENQANYQGVVEEGKEAGKIRAKDISELNNAVFNADTQLTTLNDLGSIISSPEFKNMRQLSLAGGHEIGYYSKFGTPEQKEMVGRLITDTGNIIKDNARDFPGQFRKGEQSLLNNMKVNTSDMPETAVGKAESLNYFIKMAQERSRLTSQFMNKNHVNKLEALEQADKQLNGDAIRGKIYEQLHPRESETNADATKFLDKKFSNAAEFKSALDTLNDKQRQAVIAEMRQRGWH